MPYFEKPEPPAFRVGDLVICRIGEVKPGDKPGLFYVKVALTKSGPHVNSLSSSDARLLDFWGVTEGDEVALLIVSQAPSSGALTCRVIGPPWLLDAEPPAAESAAGSDKAASASAQSADPDDDEAALVGEAPF